MKQEPVPVFHGFGCVIPSFGLAILLIQIIAALSHFSLLILIVQLVIYLYHTSIRRLQLFLVEISEN